MTSRKSSTTSEENRVDSPIELVDSTAESIKSETCPFIETSPRSIPSELTDLFGVDIFEKRIFKGRNSGPDVRLKTGEESRNNERPGVVLKRANSAPSKVLRNED